MNPVLVDILTDVLEIQKDKLAAIKDEVTNAREALRVVQALKDERQAKVDALKEALDAAGFPQG
jgi:sulfur transfer complex TusBCD TusB component (DsrH family)